MEIVNPSSLSAGSNLIDSEAESFKFQLDILKTEIELIDRAIARFDGITQSLKNWAVVIWAGSVALTLRQPDLRDFMIYTTVVPLLFWYIDAWFRHLQKRTTYRQKKIAEFLNDERLVESFSNHKLVNFKVLDPVGIQYVGTKEYREATKLWRIFKFREISVFYGGLAAISLVMGIGFLLGIL